MTELSERHRHRSELNNRYRQQFTANGLLIGPWIALAFVIALSNCLVELYSPRGTDDFTMATANALICVAFGAWVV